MDLRGCAGWTLNLFLFPCLNFPLDTSPNALFCTKLLWSCLSGTICPEVYHDLGKLCQRPCAQSHRRGIREVSLHKPWCSWAALHTPETSSALRNHGKNPAQSACLIQFYLLSGHQTPALCLFLCRLLKTKGFSVNGYYWTFKSS